MSKRRRGSRGGAKRPNRTSANKAVFNYNAEVNAYLEWFVSICQNRYIWHDLPSGTNTRFLEKVLLQSGVATIAATDDMPSVWLSIRAAFSSDINVYGDPITWHAIGENGKTQFDVRSGVNGVLVWDRESRITIWYKLVSIAQKLARYSLTENINLLHQFTPFLITAPEEMQLSIINAFAQVMEGQPAIVGYPELSTTINNGAISAINTQTPWIGDKLQSGAIGAWGEFFRLTGIPHLQYEKRDRLITDEAQATMSPTKLALLDGLKSRQRACDDLNLITGGSAWVEIAPEILESFKGGSDINDNQSL